MTRLWNKGWLVAAFIVAGATNAMAATRSMPRPGLLNSVQGQVNLDGHPTNRRATGREALRAGQVIETQHGKAELLLTPGSFLRLGPNSEVRMLSRSFANTRVKVLKGMGLLDARAGYKHDLAILMDGTTTRIDNQGIYGFSANRETISVLHGKATVYQGDSRITLKANHQLTIASHVPLEARKLNKQAFKSNSLYQWNEARNKYESLARNSVQRSIRQSGRWHGRGWYWSGFWGFYTYVRSPGMFFAPYYGAYYGPWGWNDWDSGWGGGGGWGDDDDGD